MDAGPLKLTPFRRAVLAALADKGPLSLEELPSVRVWWQLTHPTEASLQPLLEAEWIALEHGTYRIRRNGRKALLAPNRRMK